MCMHLYFVTTLMNCTWTKCCTVSNLQNSPVFMCSLQVMLTGYVRSFNHWCKNPKEVSAEMREYPVPNKNVFGS